MPYVALLHSGLNTHVYALTLCFYPTWRPCSNPPCGVSQDRPLPDTTPRREDRGAKEGPCLTAPGNDSLQMLCRVTSANHNSLFKTHQKCETKNRAVTFSVHIITPRDLRREEDAERTREKEET